MESKKLLSENSALREKFRREEMFDSIATTLCTREAKALQLLVGGATRRRRGSELRVRRFGKNRHTSSDRPNPINNHITELLVGIMLR